LSLNAEGKLVANETMKFYKVDVNRDFAREEFNRFDLTAVESSKHVSSASAKRKAGHE